MVLWFLLTLTPCRRRRDTMTMGQKAAQPHPKVNVDEAAESKGPSIWNIWYQLGCLEQSFRWAKNMTSYLTEPHRWHSDPKWTESFAYWPGSALWCCVPHPSVPSTHHTQLLWWKSEVCWELHGTEDIKCLQLCRTQCPCHNLTLSCGWMQAEVKSPRDAMWSRGKMVLGLGSLWTDAGDSWGRRQWHINSEIRGKRKWKSSSCPASCYELASRTT